MRCDAMQRDDLTTRSSARERVIQKNILRRLVLHIRYFSLKKSFFLLLLLNEKLVHKSHELLICRFHLPKLTSYPITSLFQLFPLASLDGFADK